MKKLWLIPVILLVAFGLLFVGCAKDDGDEGEDDGGGGLNENSFIIFEKGKLADGVKGEWKNDLGEDGDMVGLVFDPELDAKDYDKLVIIYKAGDFTSWWVGGKTEDKDGEGDKDWCSGSDGDLGKNYKSDKGAELVFPIKTIKNLKLIMLQGGGNDGAPEDKDNIDKIYMTK